MIPCLIILESILIGLITMVLGLPSGMIATKILQFIDKSHEPYIQNNYNEYKSSGIYLSFFITGLLTYLILSLIKRGVAGDLEGSVNVCGLDVALPSSSLQNQNRDRRNANIQ